MVPSDLSSAAFFLVAALLVPGADVYIRGVGLNPTRSALLDFLTSAGANIRIESVAQLNGELIGNLRVRHSAMRGGVIEKDLTAGLIDEIPVLAVLGAVTEEGIVIRDAHELRVKETDRISTLAENFRRMGIRFEETPDGMSIPGKTKVSSRRLRFLRRPPHRDGVFRRRARRRWTHHHRPRRCRLCLVPGIL